MTLDSVRVALRGVLANRLRSALTMLGILIGTSAVIMLVAVGTGISDGVQNQIRALGTNALYVIPERNARGRDRGGTSARRIRLTADDVKALSDKVRVPDANVVTPTVSTTGTVTWEGVTY
ncbi:MAG TPA: ABC transporter permease, partial [Acidimicrobiia bacterium]|nr:ABC transporter permease [Acidimicrobiia bacterium]